MYYFRNVFLNLLEHKFLFLIIQYRPIYAIAFYFQFSVEKKTIQINNCYELSRLIISIFFKFYSCSVLKGIIVKEFIFHFAIYVLISSCLLHYNIQLEQNIISKTKKEFFSLLQMIREFLPEMIQRNEGHIVAIGSVCSFASGSYYSMYCATKHGVLGQLNKFFTVVFHSALHIYLYGL